jgi:plastocyanin
MYTRAIGLWLSVGIGVAVVLGGCTAQQHSVVGKAGNDYVASPRSATAAATQGVDSSGVDNEPISTVPVILMGVSVFSGSHNILVKAGTVVQIQNTVDGGGLHLIYTGKVGNFEAEAGAPPALDNATGIILKKGETGSYTFTTPGVYYITCQYHPAMLVKITVTP